MRWVALPPQLAAPMSAGFETQVQMLVCFFFVAPKGGSGGWRGPRSSLCEAQAARC